MALWAVGEASRAWHPVMIADANQAALVLPALGEDPYVFGEPDRSIELLDLADCGCADLR